MGLVYCLGLIHVEIESIITLFGTYLNAGITTGAVVVHIPGTGLQGHLKVAGGT